MDKILDEERMYKEKDYTPDEIKKARNTKEYAKLIDNYLSYINTLNPAQNTLLKKAVIYTKNNANELFTYRESGYIDVSNNLILSPKIYYPQLFTFSAI